MGWRARSCSLYAFAGRADQQQDHCQKCQTDFAFAVHVMPSMRFLAMDRPVRPTRKSLDAKAQAPTRIRDGLNAAELGAATQRNSPSRWARPLMLIMIVKPY